MYKRLFDSKLHHGNPHTPLPLTTRAVWFYQRMFCQLPPNRLPQDPCTLTMNYPYLIIPGHKGIIQVPVKLKKGFLNGESANVQFIRWCSTGTGFSYFFSNPFSFVIVLVRLLISSAFESKNTICGAAITFHQDTWPQHPDGHRWRHPGYLETARARV